MNLLKQTLSNFPKHLLDVNSLPVSRVDYRRGKSLSQNWGRSPVFVAQIMLSQLFNLTGERNASMLWGVFLGGFSQISQMFMEPLR